MSVYYNPAEAKKFLGIPNEYRNNTESMLSTTIRQNRSQLTSVIRSNFLTQRDLDRRHSHIFSNPSKNLFISINENSVYSVLDSKITVKSNKTTIQNSMEDSDTIMDQNFTGLSAISKKASSIRFLSFKNSISVSEVAQWDSDKITEVKEEIKTIHQDLCDILCIGCYYIYSSLINYTDTTQFLTRNMKINRPFRMDVRKKEDYSKEWDNEVNLMRFIQHTKPSPFVLMIKDTLQTHGHVMMVFEYMEFCTIESRMRNKQLTEKQSLFYAECILLAISHLHKLKIVHRNITLKCIYLSSLGVAKISDFRKAYKEDRLYLNEDFLRNKYKDIHSWAICLQNMLSGEILATLNIASILAFENPDAEDLLKKVLDRTFLVEKCEFVSTLPPSDASSIPRIMKHPVFKSVNWVNFNIGLVISPDFHHLVVEKKVCPKKQWLEILNADIYNKKFDDKCYLKEYLWIKCLDSTLKDLY